MGRQFVIAVVVAQASALNCSWGQVAFVQVQSQSGLSNTVLYGPTFDFSSDSPSARAMKQAMQKNMGNGAAVGDFDNDGDPDIYLLRQIGFTNRLFRNDLVGGARVFTNVTAAAGVGDTGLGRTAQFADLDNDGWDDLILLNDDLADGPYPHSKIYRNNGNGTFTDVTSGSNFDPFGLIKGGMCLGDYDSDGLLDIYVAQWTMELGEGLPGFPGHNQLYRNIGDFVFEDVTFSTGLGILQRDSFACVFADFDNDQDADLYIAVDHTSDAYYRNNGDGTFTDTTVAVGATHTGNDMGISVFDFDNDSDLDVYSTNITDPSGIFGTTQYNTLLINQLDETGTFALVDEAEPRGVRDTYWGWGTEFLDVDNDSDLDLYAVNGFDEFIAALGGQTHPLVDTPEVLFINDGAGIFSRSSGTGADFAGDARAAIALDYNLDGRQDLLVTNILEPAVLLENRSMFPENHWLSVELIGPCGQNADAVGGRIEVVDGGGTAHLREVIAGGSYLSGRPLVQHFGLGGWDVIVHVKARFPDGVTYGSHYPPVLDHRVAILYGQPPEIIVGWTLFDFAQFQRCVGAHCGNVELALDADGDGELTVTDLDEFIVGLEWVVPGCVEE